MSNLVSELERLQQLHRSGALSDEEFVRAKAVALGTDAPGSVAPSSAGPERADWERLHLQNEVEQLDRQWMLEREKLMTVGKRGARSVPSRGAGIAVSCITGGFGLLWTLFAGWIASHFPFPISVIFPLFGVLFIAAAIGGGVSEYKRAGQYEKAERQYQARRAELVARQQR